MPKRNFTTINKQNKIKLFEKSQLLQLIKDNDDNLKKLTF